MDDRSLAGGAGSWRAGIADDRVLPSAYDLTTPASPHLAAERDGIEIDLARLRTVPRLDAPLIIEGAGGLMVPLTRQHLQVDLFAAWSLPVVLVAATRLGTINHSLLSVEALRRRGIPLLGIVFTGEENADTERTIPAMAGARRLGRLPHQDPLDAATLRSAFAANFDIADFLAAVRR